MTSPCIEWHLRRDKGGYGRKWYKGATRAAHRVAWEKANGPIPTGMTIDHLCFNPGCVNLEHMRLLSPIENMRNQRQKYRTHCKNGHEYTTENTRLEHGKRICRKCRCAYSKTSRERGKP